MFPSWFARKASGSATTTRYPPAGIETFGNVKSTPLVNFQPFKLIGALSMLRSSIHSSFVRREGGWNIISLITTLSANTAFGFKTYVHWPPAKLLGGDAKSAMP